MSTQPTDPNIFKLINVRLSFPQLFTAKAIEEGKEPQFSAVFLLDNHKHGQILDAIDAGIERVALDFFKKKVSLKHRCLRDGNERPDVDGYGDGVSFITASNKQRPVVVHKNPSIPLTESDGVIYAGCYVNATIRLYAWEHKTGGRGVSANLRAVQFAADGDSFGAGKVDAEAEFDNISDDAGQQQQSHAPTRSARSTGGTKPSIGFF